MTLENAAGTGASAHPAGLPEKQSKSAQEKKEESEEDKQLAETLGMLVERLQEPDISLHKPALEALRTQIRSSAVSMTSIPKAIKFLRTHYQPLVAIYNNWANEDNKKFLADIVSVMAMTYSGDEHKVTGDRDTLKYRLLGQQQPIGDWGHEYVRHLAMEITQASQHGDNIDSDQLHTLTMDIVRFFLEHNAEPDACDLLFEVGKLSVLVDLVASSNGNIDHQRICLYLVSCVPYEADGDDRVALEVAHQIYRRVGDLPNALVLAMRLNSMALVVDDFQACENPALRCQLAYMLARQRINIATDDDQLKSILSNSFLTDHFQALARELEIVPPKSPEDIYKSHLQDTLRVAAAPTAHQNLASALVNGFLNAGHGTDKLLTSPEIEADETKSWIYKTKDHGITSTVASLGLLHLWNPDVGIGKLDRYLYSENVNIRAGAILGIGLVHVGTRNEADPALALLREHLDDPSAVIKIAAIMGLALAYGGSARVDLVDVLSPYVGHENVQIGAMAALALGHVFVGTCDGDVASSILQTMMERDPAQLNDPGARFFGLALALLFLGKSEAAAEVILETLQAIEHPIGQDAITLVKICSHVGSGNVLKIQELLRLCTTTTADDESNNDGGASSTLNHQTFAVVGVALICMMEDIGKEMSHRLFSHLMHYGNPSVRKAIPLALGLLYASHPAVTVMDLLSKYSHDHDKAVAVNAIFAMGLIAGGTNNAKMAQMLRQLAAYYQRDADCLYMVRIAQGLVHAGKGTVTFSPIHSHRLLYNPAAVAGLLTTIVAFTDAQSLVLENTSFVLYFLTAAIYPRFVITLDENLKALPVTVRVGQAVDVVGQAGKPKTITGFQTHTTPVLVAYQERAELGTEEYLPLAPIIENFVILTKNPHWVDEPVLGTKKK